ncbi:DUF1761 domain-containing protein [Cryobacterium sp. GrIS_2_6]|uniref:DUF1761 domain-containing protein n=1 Tax=Cryobacterium sp. GrIS_2_6 TaxID=3162785 RepID=UPI002DFAE7D1|nr:hypothetical protein [Cryobacterium psychrotolerans]
MVPEINIWAVLLATASSMAVGSVWYSRRVFGGYWMRTVGHDEESMRGNAVAPIVITALVSFVTAWVLAGAIAITQNFYGGSFLANALLTALILWAGFTAARMVTHDVFDRRPAGLTVLNLAHELVTLEVMALIIGLIGINAL